MARTAVDRLEVLVDAALVVFARKGYAAAQVVDIAREAGVAVGTVYNNVEGKGALLLLGAARAFDVPLEAAERPVAAPSPSELVSTLAAHLDEHARVPALERSLAARRRPADAVAELVDVVVELHDLVAHTRLGADALERSAHDVPELAELFYVRVRGRLLDQLASLLDRRSRQGVLHLPPGGPSVAATFVIETVTWFARHRHHHPDGSTIDAEVARASVAALVSRAFAP